MEEKTTELSQSVATENQTVATFIDGYCERNHQPDVLAEPLNLLTNIAFIIAAVMAFKSLKFFKLINAKCWDIVLLSVLLAIIGFGSAAFHSYPNKKTVLMDVIPIAIFMHLYLFMFFKRVVGLNFLLSTTVLLSFIATGFVFQKTISPDTLNGTIMYVPAYSFLIIMVLILCFVKQSPLYLHLINTAVIWTFSLAFRTMDMQICTHTHYIGTHFLWHLLNAIVLYRLVILVIIDKTSKEKIG